MTRILRIPLMPSLLASCKIQFRALGRGKILPAAANGNARCRLTERCHGNSMKGKHDVSVVCTRSSGMGLFDWNFRSPDDEQLREVAERIVQLSLHEVLQRVTGLTPDMLPAEARGYIRTRAAKVVNREIAAALAGDRRLRSVDRTRLSGLVTDTLVAAVADQRRTLRRTIAA
jgi:hypothetical protein